MFGLNWFSKKNLCFIDLETTGLDKGSEIVEIACDLNGNHFQSLVKPICPIPEEVIKVHNITNEMVAHAPNIKEVLLKLNEFLQGHENLFFVGHNLVRFDIPILKSAYLRSSLEFPKVKYIDTLNLSEWYYPDCVNHRLQTMCVHLGVSIPCHRAIEDVKCTKELFEKMKQEQGFSY